MLKTGKALSMSADTWNDRACDAGPSSAGSLDVLANAKLLQQGGEAACEKIGSTLLAHFSQHTEVGFAPIY